MDQLLQTLSDLHQAASGIFHRAQQTQVPWGGSSSRPLATAGKQQIMQGPGRRVRFAPPFASITNPFGFDRNDAGKGDKQFRKKGRQQDEEEERILISEV